MSHPLAELLEWFPENDFAVLAHGFAPHGRDYEVLVETQASRDPGRHRLIFTHAVEVTVSTQILDDVWTRSWTDVFTDCDQWKTAGEPDGYVWGVTWSLAYPGFSAPVATRRAEEWAGRLGQPMHEATMSTNQFRLDLVFHQLRTIKVDDRTDMVSQVVIPLDE